MTTEQSVKLKDLQKQVKDAENALKLSSKEDIMANFEKLDAAKKALEKYEDSLITPEQKKAQKAYDDALKAMEATKLKMEEAKAKLKELFPASPSLKGSGKGGGNHAPKENGYEIAQAVRKAYSEGNKKVVDIAKEFDISTSAVNYYVNYLQHKLKKGDTEYTPLVNKYYPFGAPYAEDDIKEDDSRYTVKKYTIYDLYSDFTGAAMPLPEMLKKYALTPAKMEALIKEQDEKLKKVA